MSAGKESDNQAEPKKPADEEKKIHKTHFPVIKVPLRKTDYDDGYEWVKIGDGREKRVPKKPQDGGGK